MHHQIRQERHLRTSNQHRKEDSPTSKSEHKGLRDFRLLCKEVYTPSLSTSPLSMQSGSTSKMALVVEI